MAGEKGPDLQEVVGGDRTYAENVARAEAMFERGEVDNEERPIMAAPIEEAEPGEIEA